ncbi:N-acetylgalactosamine-N, N'-diacetylbacillosaminyl-diphospho-undecaprenol 4-alpha-N-acetylgalactosaminyltransferase [Chryseobacterium oranimense G311]|uniref:glycosyltransferase n=1 Tax=Chryseobacterium oranimense TaxID=421058 RepID=UPI000533AE06|nr:glycosyltransferase [Chryseobacterium oranimense]CEJ70995.1 N-acetylgalactosamine-N, N'-diacetylbacillosaminyl-diphospho-undecaprenol 4-alpha-N-acetylgalactosaminyltransferase [Chryseobacterium oranimense G311]
MKILHIIDGLGTGGAEKLLTEIVPGLVEEGCQVDVLLLNGEITPFYKKLEDGGCCNIFSLGNRFYHPLYVIKIIPYLSKYDVVHVHLFPAQYFAALAKMIGNKNVKLIFTEHSTSNNRIENNKFKRIEKFIYSFYNKIICITHGVKSKLIEKLDIPEEKLVVIENGINIQDIKNAPKANRIDFGYSENDRLLIMVASFRPNKDQDTLIRTLSLLPNNYKLILVGDGGDRREIVKNLAKSLKVENRINFLGIRADVYSLLKMCDIAILSSHAEGFGLAAVESMVCGIPLVASNVDGLAQVVNGGGMLFEKGNEEDLKSKIISLEDKDYYIKVAERGLAKAYEFDIKKMIQSTLELYSSL